MDELYKDRCMKMFASPDTSITVMEALGTRIKTKEYGELIDFESGCWAAVLGHSKKEVVETIVENAGHLFHTHQYFDTEHPGALVKELTEASKLNGNYKGTFMSSGSEAVSLAVLLAELVTGRLKKLSLSISYLGTSPELRMPRNLNQWVDLDVYECLNCTKDSNCEKCGKYNHIDFSHMAAFVFESGNSGGLVLCPPDKLITFLVKNIRNSGGFVIANEVTTGFGRTGKWFGFQHYKVFDCESSSPDFIAVGKGLGNGYPISGLLVHSELAEIVESIDFRYVQSHTDDPLGCMVARKVIEVMLNENLVEYGNKIGEYFRHKLAEIGERTGGIMEVRGRGMMNVAVLDKRHKASEVFKVLLERGFFIGYSDVYNYLHFYAPLIIKSEEIDNLCNSLELILESDSTIKFK
ncbi:aminotransferase class III-fold pyridoxal phosphate-dependent enzyme [Tissierella carlieri]|uniref:aminotransferase class III-fold pyridoxal phosphate-dependent enzyme n=1 Tax=Tissierella carlieri TaxID=689904 RepID=UPI001C0F8324|nr:aminotransferase class III-fold pyridoxal phosphate-dependent enzyme [Tissierella carlieri]